MKSSNLTLWTICETISRMEKEKENFTSAYSTEGRGIHIHTRVCAHSHTLRQTLAQIQTRKHTHHDTQTCTRPRTHTYTHTNTHKLTHIHTHTYTHKHTHIHTHTHTHDRDTRTHILCLCLSFSLSHIHTHTHTTISLRFKSMHVSMLFVSCWVAHVPRQVRLVLGNSFGRRAVKPVRLPPPPPQALAFYWTKCGPKHRQGQSYKFTSPSGDQSEMKSSGCLPNCDCSR